jgi:hypothetical protein
MTPTVKTRHVIPLAAWIVAAALFVVGTGIGIVITIAENEEEAFFIGLLVSALIAGYALMVGYVHGDAKRRGMRYMLWTWLAILVPNGIGILLYFILRDPLLTYCTKCGFPTQRGFAYCPRCGAGVAPTCPQCHKVLQPGWSNCAYCGIKL